VRTFKAVEDSMPSPDQPLEPPSGDLLRTADAFLAKIAAKTEDEQWGGALVCWDSFASFIEEHAQFPDPLLHRQARRHARTLGEALACRDRVSAHSELADLSELLALHMQGAGAQPAAKP
jgi:hypothetical protein